MPKSKTPHAAKTFDPQVVLQAWLPFKAAMGVTSVHSKQDYAKANAAIEALLNEVGNDENHPLSEVLDYLADQVRAYEEEQIQIPTTEPHEILRFLMEQHGLRQEDLQDCAPQSRISDILNCKRAISKEIAKKFARRFRVRADLFL